MNRIARLSGLAAAASLLGGCNDSESVAGNYTSTGNALAARGKVVRTDGTPAEGAWVECRPDSLASWMPLSAKWMARTDSVGNWICEDLPPGPIGVGSWDPSTGLSRWRSVLAAKSTDSTRPSDTLVKPGRLRVALPPNSRGTLYLEGLGQFLPIQGDTVVEFPGVPAGWHGTVRFASDTSLSGYVGTGNVTSGKVDSSGFTRTSATILIPLAGGSKTALRQFPVLVRLDSTWKGFSRTLPDGSDLRLSLPNGTALPMDVVSWDRIRRIGALWTVLDSIPAPADTVRLVLGWGVPVPATAPKSGFAAANGWIAAWPMGDSGATTKDLTGGFAGSNTGVSSVAGVVGRASLFDGRTSMVQIANSTTGTLDFPEGGSFTISCWVRLADYGTSRILAGHGTDGYMLKFQRNFGTDTNRWMAGVPRSGRVNSWYNNAPADTGVWTHLAATYADSVLTIYVNGVARSAAPRAISNGIASRPGPFLIGASIEATGEYGQHFKGALEDVWVHSALRTADWIRQSAFNQAPGAPKAIPR